MIGQLLTAGDGADVYTRFHSHWRNHRALVIGGRHALLARPPQGVPRSTGGASPNR